MSAVFKRLLQRFGALLTVVPPTVESQICSADGIERAIA
jgi:hypothetical protein